jgi:hypothetical protein
MHRSVVSMECTALTRIHTVHHGASIHKYMLNLSTTNPMSTKVMNLGWGYDLIRKYLRDTYMGLDPFIHFK